MYQLTARMHPYSQNSNEFNVMKSVAEGGIDGGIAAYAMGNSYFYGSTMFCKEWYETFVLKIAPVEEYEARVKIIKNDLNRVSINTNV